MVYLVLWLLHFISIWFKQVSNLTKDSISTCITHSFSTKGYYYLPIIFILKNPHHSNSAKFLTFAANNLAPKKDHFLATVR